MTRHCVGCGHEEAEHLMPDPMLFWRACAAYAYRPEDRCQCNNFRPYPESVKGIPYEQ